MKKRILIVVGSFREHSLNKALAKEIEGLLQDQAETAFLEYKDIPYMNQDLESEVPQIIRCIRDQVMAFDGVWFVTPEYNYSYSGVLKNLIDWLSRPLNLQSGSITSAMTGKKVTISGAGGRKAAEGARLKLMELLLFIQAKPLRDVSVGIALPPESFMSDQLILNEEDRRQLQWQADAFCDFLNENETQGYDY